MSRLVSPLCLVLSLATVVAGFTFLLAGRHEPSIELHRALVTGDEQYAEALENQLKNRQRARTFAIVALFVASGVLAMAAFLTMRPAEARRGRRGS